MLDQMPTLTETLRTIDEAILDRLEVIAERDHQRQLARLAEERRILQAKTEFARVLSERIAKEWGVALAADLIFANLEYDGYESNFRLKIEFELLGTDAGAAVRGTLRMQHVMSLQGLCEGRPIPWQGYRNVAKSNDGTFDYEDCYPDYNDCKTDDLIEAITYVKTGKK